MGTALAALLVLLGAGPAQAVTKTVSFDDLPPGTDGEHAVPDVARGVLPGASERRRVPEDARFRRAAHSGTGGSADMPAARRVVQLAHSWAAEPDGPRRQRLRRVHVGPGRRSETMTLQAFNSNGQDRSARRRSTVNPGARASVQQVSVTASNVTPDIAYFEVQGGLPSANAAGGHGRPGDHDAGHAVAAGLRLASLGGPGQRARGQLRGRSHLDQPAQRLQRQRLARGDEPATGDAGGDHPESTCGGTGATATLRLSALDSADRFVDYREITITGTPGPGAGLGHADGPQARAHRRQLHAAVPRATTSTPAPTASSPSGPTSCRSSARKSTSTGSWWSPPRATAP